MPNRDFELLFKARADFAQANREFDSTQRKFGGLIKSLNSAGTAGNVLRTGLIGIGAAVAGSTAIATAFMSKYIANTIEAEKVQAQLASRIKDTSSAAGRSLQQLNDQADKLQKLTVFDDEAIGSTQAMLLTFKEIQGLQFDRAVEATLDLSTAMGTDLNSAALQLGKALNDPVAGLSALGRAGVQFSDDQKKVIKALVESGEVAKAQELILDELESQMGTAAEAARNTLGGALQALKNSFDNLLEGDAGGAGVVGTRDAIEQLIDTLNDPDIKRGVDETAEGLINIANAAVKVISFVGQAGSALADYFGDAQKRSNTVLENQRTELETEMFHLERMQKRFGKVGVVSPLGALFGEGGDRLATVKREIAEIDNILGARSKRDAEEFARNRGLDPLNGLFVPEDPSVRNRGAKPDDKKKTKVADPEAGAKKRLADLTEEIALLNTLGEGEEKASKAAEIRYAITDGEYKNVSASLKKQLLDQATVLDQKYADIEAEKERKKRFEEAKEAYKRLTDELRTPAEAALAEAIAQVETLNASLQAGIAKAEDYDKQIGRIAKGLIADQPDFQGLAPEVGGAFGELSKLDAAAEKESKWYQDSLQRLQAFRDARKENQAAADAEEERLNAQHQDRMQDIEASRQQATLSIASDFFGQLATLQRSENSKIAAIGKAAAIAQALINTYQAATAAYAALAPIPYVGPALGVAAAAAAVAAGLANVAQIRAQPTGFSEGGYTGPGGKYQPAGIVHKGEGVLSQEEIRALGGPSGFQSLRDAIDDGSLRQRMYGWAGYADGGFVSGGNPQLPAPNWESHPQGGLNLPTPQMHLRNINLFDIEDIARRVFETSHAEKSVLNVASNNPKAMRAALGG